MKLMYCLLALCLQFQLLAQVSGSTSVGVPMVGVHYGGAFSGGDLAARYGYFNRLGFTAGYKFKSQWYVGLESDFWFSDNVRLTGLFDALVDSHGTITSDAGVPASILVYPRGVHANVQFGRLFPLNTRNENSGILVHVGTGYMLHHLRIESNSDVVPSLELDYKKGYDRLTTGINFQQFVGYSFQNNKGPYSFYAGLYFQQGLTYNRRTINFDQPNIPVSTLQRLDLQTGFRIGWYIPFYSSEPRDYYYN
ncbi:MAG: hypothetical protein RLZZ301_398 [Bacteroidota bacterium]|jgi:hypothetical protein